MYDNPFGEENPLIPESPPDDKITIFEVNGTKFWTYKVSPHKDKCDCHCHIGEAIWDNKHCKCGFSMGSMRFKDGNLANQTKENIEMGHHDPSLSWATPYVRKKKQ